MASQEMGGMPSKFDQRKLREHQDRCKSKQGRTPESVRREGANKKKGESQTRNEGRKREIWEMRRETSYLHGRRSANSDCEGET